jgi:hypothetical protein
MKPFVVDRGDCDRVYAVRISVEVALITACSTIATSKYEDRTLSTPSVVYTVYNSFLDEVAWAFHRHAVIGRSPATAIDGNILETIIKCGSFIHI